MPKNRKELQRQFAAEIYLSASFFKMKSVGSQALDASINSQSEAIRPFPHPSVATRYIPTRDKMPKLKAARFDSTLFRTFHETPTLSESEGTKMHTVTGKMPTLEIVDLGTKFLIHTTVNKSPKWWKYSYESLERAGSCLEIIRRAWLHAPNTIEDELKDLFVNDITDIEPAILNRD